MTYNKSKWTPWMATDLKSVILINPKRYCHPTRVTSLVDGFIIKVSLSWKQVFRKNAQKNKLLSFCHSQ